MASKRTNGEGHYRERVERRETKTGKVTERRFWECQITLPTGKRKSIYGTTLADVKRKRKDALKLIDAGIDIGAKPDTMATFLQGWLDDVVKVHNRPRTHQSYASYVRLHIEPAIGCHKLRELRQSHVDAMLRGMTDKGLSPRTVAYARAILRAALTYAVRAGLIDRNAAQFAKPPARKQTERPYLTAEQSMRLLDTAREHDPDLLPLITTALYTGLRFGELAGLGWADIDLAERRLRVRRTVYWINGEFGFGEPKTHKSARTLTLARPAIAALQEQSDRQAFLKKQPGIDGGPMTWCFRQSLVPRSIAATRTGDCDCYSTRRDCRRPGFTCCGIPARPCWLPKGYRYGWSWNS